MAGVKEELAKKAESTKVEKKLTKSMSIADLIKAMLYHGDEVLQG